MLKYLNFLNRNNYADGSYRTYLRGVLHIFLSLFYLVKIINDLIYNSYNFKYYIYSISKLYSYSMSAILHAYPFYDIDNCHIFSILDWIGIIINGFATNFPYIENIYLVKYLKLGGISSILILFITLIQLKATKYNYIYISNLFRNLQIYLITLITLLSTILDLNILNFTKLVFLKHLSLYIGMMFAFLKYSTKKKMIWHIKDYNDYHEDFHFFMIIYDIFSYQINKKYFKN